MTDSDDDAKAPAEEAAPAKKKRKKKRKKKLERVPTLDAAGRERPRFLLSFPRDTGLDRLVAAFESGDYATVRSDAMELAEKTEDERVRDAALELRRRIEPDPLVRYLLLAAIVLLTFLVLHSYGHKP
jgi:hypothetical protein